MEQRPSAAARRPSPETLRVADGTRTFTRNKQVVQALGDLTLTIDRGEFVTIVGPSGCGKSTLLHVLGGFDRLTSGVVTHNGQVIERPSRLRGMVFQEANLLAWRTIGDNVAWPMIVAGQRRRTATARANELLARVGLRGFEDSYPSELSGGMRQRAAIARTLGMEPDVLLMDEPFGALDALTREGMQEELVRLWQDLDITVVFITHDILEAVFLGDRVLVMSPRPGRIVESIDIDLGRPRTASTRNDPAILRYREQIWDLLATPAPERRSASEERSAAPSSHR